MADNEKLSRHDTIRQLSTDYPNTSIPALAHIAIDKGIYTLEMLNAKAYEWARADCQAAMRKRGPDGKPFAGPTEETDEENDAPVWKQRRLWTEDNYDFNCALHMGQSGGQYHTARLLDKERIQRYGGRSRVPKIGVFENA